MGVKQYVDMSDSTQRDKIKCSLDFVLNTIPFETEYQKSIDFVRFDGV